MKTISFYTFLLLIITLKVHSQTDKLNQFWNQYIFNKDLSNDWSLELDIGLTTSSIPDDRNIFHNMTQIYGRGWVHYKPAERWKVSFFYAYYFNKNVPELNQREAPEVRFAVQGLYRIIKEARFKLNVRARFEDRHMRNEDGYFEAVGRYRFQIKTVYVLSSNETSRGELYAFMSDELFFKTKSKVSGSEVFDRNRLGAGLGYFLSDNIQVEVSYANEIMPRTQTDKLVNALQINVIFNNFFPNLIKSFAAKRTELE